MLISGMAEDIWISYNSCQAILTKHLKISCTSAELNNTGVVMKPLPCGFWLAGMGRNSQKLLK
jgi:hypothetical protein